MTDKTWGAPKQGPTLLILNTVLEMLEDVQKTELTVSQFHIYRQKAVMISRVIQDFKRNSIALHRG